MRAAAAGADDPMAYDDARRRVVLFGGIGHDNEDRNDTWEVREQPLVERSSGP